MSSSVGVQPCLCRTCSETVNKNIKLSFFKSSENIQKKEVRSGFDELFPVTTFLTVSQSHDTLISMFLYIT